MKKHAFKFKLLFVCLTFICLMTGCSKSDKKVDCNSGFSLYTVTSEEIQAVSNAAVEYSQDPSPTNCDKYILALNDYVDELGKYERCAFEVGSGKDWDQAIKDARASIQNIQCK